MSICYRKYKNNNSFSKKNDKKNVYFQQKMMIFGFFMVRTAQNRDFFFIFVRYYK